MSRYSSTIAFKNEKIETRRPAMEASKNGPNSMAIINPPFLIAGYN
jgi:hypothetical protein